MRIAIIGAGNMGGAIACGLASSGRFGAGDIVCANPSTAKLDLLRGQYDLISTTTDNKVAAADADAVVIAVKPWYAERVIREISAVFDPSRQMLISVAAGVPFAELGVWAGGSGGIVPAMFRVIPNTAISVGRSMTFIAAANADERQTAAVKELFDMMGTAMVVDEKMLEAGMILASCGIAFALRYMRAAAEGGVELGFPARQAAEIVARTMAGAAELQLSNGSHPEQEIDRVTTAGGITIRGLNEMEHAGFTSAVIRGLKACR